MAPLRRLSATTKRETRIQYWLLHTSDECAHWLARIIHEDFYYNCRYVAPTSLTAATPSRGKAPPRRSARPSRMASRRFRHELS